MQRALADATVHLDSHSKSSFVRQSMSPVAMGSALQFSERMATTRRACHRNIVHDPLRARSLFDNGQRLEHCTD